MKSMFYLGCITLLASCSSAKYSAYFQKSNPAFGYGEISSLPVAKPAHSVASLQSNNAEHLIASTSKDIGIITKSNSASNSEATASLDAIRQNYLRLNKSEQKQFRKQLTKQIKRTIKAKATGTESVKSLDKPQMMDQDLKLAAIFGAVGIVGLLIGGNVFYIIGAVALIIGVVFFVMWLVRQ